MWIVIIELFRFFLYLGEKLFQFVFSIILCIFVTALFSGYTDYFHYARSFFVCVNHNFVCKTYFCELRYWWKAYLHKSCEILCKSSFQIQKTKKNTLFSWYMKEFKYLLTPNLKNKPIRYWYNFGHFTLVWNRSTFVFCCLINIKLKFSILL